MVKAEIICDSISSVNGVRLTTFVAEYPRLVHSEFLTHRMFSRNAASSRAIPFDKMLQQLDGRPVRFGEANPGMQDKGEEHEAFVMGWPQEYDGNIGCPAWDAIEAWNEAKDHAIYFSQEFKSAGYHKQVYNRLTEPFQMIRVIITATEWENFFWLRNDRAADPTLEALAKAMKIEYDKGIPKTLKPGQWHTPFVNSWSDEEDTLYWITQQFEDEEVNSYLSLDEAIKVSAARCAAVSFRNTDYDLEKSLQVYERLVGDERKHASAFEHQATPCAESEVGDECLETGNVLLPSINLFVDPDTWQDGITHVDKKGHFWSGNFRSFIQHRQLIPGHNKSAY